MADVPFVRFPDIDEQQLRMGLDLFGQILRRDLGPFVRRTGVHATESLVIDQLRYRASRGSQRMISGNITQTVNPTACRTRNGSAERKMIPKVISGGATLLR